MNQLRICFFLFILISNFSIDLKAASYLEADPNEPVVVFIPGAAASGDKVWMYGFNPIAKILKIDGAFTVFQKAIAKFGIPSFVCPKTWDEDKRTVDERIEECVSQILESRNKTSCEEGSKRNVILFGYSLGGLFARVLANDDRVSKCIYSVTSLVTPHKGTVFADMLLTSFEDMKKKNKHFRKFIEKTHFDATKVPYLPHLKFDREGYPPEVFLLQDMPDNPQVYYYSITASMKPINLAPMEFTRFMIEQDIKKRRLNYLGTASDGIVPLFSMYHGKHVGHVNAHHLSAPCIDLFKLTRECKNSQKIVIPHLRQLYGEVER